MKEIPLHQEMVSVTGSVTWTSHSPSVIGMNPDPRRQRDERHAHRYRPERTAEAVRQPAQRRKADATPLPGTVVRGRLPRFIGRCGKRNGRIEAGAFEAELRVGAGPPRTESLASRITFGSKEKESPAFNF